MVFSMTLLLACGKETESGNKIQGLNLSGSWRWIGVECWDSSFTTRTAVATVGAGSYSSTTTINGNTATAQAISSSGCTVNYSQSFVATLTSGDSTGGVGNISTGSTTASTSNGGSCSLSATLNVTSGSITPTTINTAYTQGQSVPGQTYEFVYNPPILAIPSTLQVPSSPTDICLLIYQKL